MCLLDMDKFFKDLPGTGKPLPLLSFPTATLIGADVYGYTHDASLQARGIIRTSELTDSAVAVTVMDLSVEAEAFGCEIKTSKNDVPTVIGELISDEDDAEGLVIPDVGSARTTMYVEAARMAKDAISDRPVLGGMIGPFSLAGRLCGVSEMLMNCIAEPEMSHTVIEKATAFLLGYAKAYKEAGLDGIVIAEPLAGLLSPTLESEFSAPYVKRTIDSVKDKNFAVIYHNCGPNTPKMLPSLLGNGASAYHFGDAVSLSDILAGFNEIGGGNTPVLGNISPVGCLVNGTPESTYQTVTALLTECGKYKNFVLSTGCDVPPNARWDNINAFFKAARDYRLGRK